MVTQNCIQLDTSQDRRRMRGLFCGLPYLSVRVEWIQGLWASKACWRKKMARRDRSTLGNEVWLCWHYGSSVDIVDRQNSPDCNFENLFLTIPEIISRPAKNSSVYVSRMWSSVSGAAGLVSNVRRVLSARVSMIAMNWAALPSNMSDRSFSTAVRGHGSC